jgi:DNA polymerase-3 subunit epsilon
MEICVIDTETTGLCVDNDEILEIAIIDSNGEVLMNTLVRPEQRTSWPEAQRIHGISPQDVESAPTLAQIKDEIREIVAGRIVVIYNAEYDQAMLGDCIGTAEDVMCCKIGFMQEYAFIFEETERWHKLVSAAHYVDHDWGQDAAHRAIYNANATLSVWRWLHRQYPAAYPVKRDKLKRA